MGTKETIFRKAGGGKLRHVEEWGTDVILRGMPASMRIRMTNKKSGRERGLTTEQIAEESIQLTVEALRAGLRDPEQDGNPPIFTDTEIRQLLDEDQQGVCDTLLEEIFELSGITKEALDEAKRRFSESPSEESSSSSPKSSGGPSMSFSPAGGEPSDLPS